MLRTISFKMLASILIRVEKKTIEYSQIAFPSSQITLGKLRSAHPKYFAPDWPACASEVGHNEVDSLSVMFYTERLLARTAFAKANDIRFDIFEESGLTYETCVDELCEDYQKYGVASGRHLAEQLIRSLESQAAAQAGLGR
jgi:hypothetical protein